MSSFCISFGLLFCCKATLVWVLVAAFMWVLVSGDCSFIRQLMYQTVFPLWNEFHP
ncbi:unnamed protein product [Brassica oleracea]|uniref:(rape) hypothetical protein n=1 Tax=Brassica napus TaxID=3708 RepID=A0A816J261_BRANA|nr:unnamed protein product [Brassica napus]